MQGSQSRKRSATAPPTNIATVSFCLIVTYLSFVWDQCKYVKMPGNQLGKRGATPPANIATVSNFSLRAKYIT